LDFVTTTKQNVGPVVHLAKNKMIEDKA
jgi:hypothetical protein